MSWHETRKMLHEDHRWRLTKLLDKAEKQRLFEEHVAALIRRNRELFHRVIDEFVNPVELMTISWRDVRRLIKDDPRFSKFSSSDRVCIFSSFIVCSICLLCFKLWLSCRKSQSSHSSKLKGVPTDTIVTTENCQAKYKMKVVMLIVIMNMMLLYRFCIHFCMLWIYLQVPNCRLKLVLQFINTGQLDLRIFKIFKLS